MKSIYNLEFFLCIFLLMSAFGLHAQTQPAASLIITNAKVWTVDKQHPAAEAVADVAVFLLPPRRNAENDPRRGPHTKNPGAAATPLLPWFYVAHVPILGIGGP